MRTGSAVGLLLLAGGCLSANIGMEETTQVVLSSSGDSSGAESTAASGIMTTTEDPDRTSGDSAQSESAAGTDTSSADTSGTTGIPAMCGDGVVQADAGEGCDKGKANADDGECTSHCQPATCGDGLLQAGVEVCDDGVNDGSYNGCKPGCTGFAAYCGDGILQAPESCDEAEPNSGCLPETCTYAKSCKQIKDAHGDMATDGLYTIAPLGTKLQVICDMDADGGGYTFLKVSRALPVGAKAAELECAKYGMRLLVPRSQAHLTATILVAQSDVLGPVGVGMTKASLGYLKIFGIYPQMDYQGCPGQPFNNVDCPQWTAVGEVFWVTGESFPNEPYKSEPATKSCAQCSMEYYWSNGVLTGYQSVIGNNGEGAQSELFLCEVPDMLPLK